MGFHHVAIAVRDAEASHRFYTEAMGFTLVRTEVIEYLQTGWARHLFYETGDGTMLALWDLHHDSGPVTKTGISIDLGFARLVTPAGVTEPLPLIDAVTVNTSIEKYASIAWFAATFENV